MKLVVLTILLNSPMIFPQINSNVLFTPSGFTQPLLSGYGESAIKNSAANAGSLNPAALGLFDNISTGISYQYETDVDEAWGINTKDERILNAVPQSFGLIIPVKNFSAALSMNQLYNGYLNFHIPYTTSEQPDGTGEFFDINRRTKLYSYSFTASYSFFNISNRINISIGARFNYNHLQHRSEEFYYYIDDSFPANNYSVGFILSKSEENQFINIGLSYNSELRYDEEVDINWKDKPIYDYRSDYIVVTRRLFAEIPSSLRLDIYGGKSEKFEFTGSFAYRFWKNIGDNFKNQPEVSGNVIYKANELFSSSIGINYTDRNFEDFAGFNENFHSVYFTLGGVLKFYGFDLHLVLADNRLFSGDYIKQTIAKAGLNYEF